MKKIVLFRILMLISINFIFTGEFEIIGFINYQTSSDAIGLRIDTGGGVVFNAFNDVLETYKRRLR